MCSCFNGVLLRALPSSKNIYEDHLTIDANIELIATDLMKFGEWYSDTEYVPEVFSILNESSFVFGKHLNQNFLQGYEIAWKKYLPEIGFQLLKDFTKKGIVTKCCQALINFAFAMTDIEKIFIKCDISNTRSYAIALKLGFEFVEQVKGGCYNKNGKAEMISFELRKPVVL